jgi:hypothetical protein
VKFFPDVMGDAIFLFFLGTCLQSWHRYYTVLLNTMVHLLGSYNLQNY